MAVFGNEALARLVGADPILEDIIRVLGPEGTLVIPAFGFQQSQGPIRIPTFAEALLHIPGATLSNHPTHPVVAVGRLAVIITENHGSAGAFGRNTPVYKILQAKAKMLQVGCDFSENPIVFLAEELTGVPYIARSRPVSITLSSGKTVTKWIRQPGCHLGFGVLAETISDSDSYAEEILDGTQFRLMDVRAVFDAASDALSISPDALLCLEPNCELCAEARAMIEANAAEESDKLITEQAEEEERMTRDLEQRLNGITKFVDSSDAGFSSN